MEKNIQIQWKNMNKIKQFVKLYQKRKIRLKMIMKLRKIRRVTLKKLFNIWKRWKNLSTLILLLMKISIHLVKMFSREIKI